MNDSRTLEILLRLKADAAGAQQIRTELQAVQAQAAQTAAALNQTATRTIRDTSGLPAGQDRGDSAAAVALRAQLDAQVAVRNSLRGLAGQTLVLDQQSVLAAELSAAAEAKKVLQMERQLIIEIQLEAAEARLAGNPAMAAKLEREAAIRLQALTIQRATNVSMELALAQAERLTLAQEAAAVKTAGSVTFTRGQATALAQQLATGRVSAESISRSFSGFGTTLSIAGIAGYALYQIIASAADEAVRLAKEIAGQTAELEKQVREWNQLAQSSSDFGDVIKLSEAFQPQLDALAAKLAEFRATELTAWQQFIDVLTRTFGSAIPGQGPSFNRGNLDAATTQQDLLLRNTIRLNAALDAQAQKAKAAWEDIQLQPLNTAIETQTALVDAAREKYAGLVAQRDRLLEAPVLDAEATRQAIELNRQITEAAANLQLQTRHVEELTTKQSKLATETDKAAEALRKVDLSQLDESGQLAALDAQLLEIQEKLQQLGLDAASPHDALEKSKDLTAETREEVIKLAQAWAAVLGEISRVTQQQEDDRRKAAEKAQNDALRERRDLMRQIRQEQRAVTENPFLSLADRNAQLIPLLLREAEAHEAAGDAAEAHARKMEALSLAFSGDLQANITAWANSFGTSAQQIGGFITGSINEALQATNALITEAIFGTGDWRQTVIGLEKAILNMFLTMIEKMVLQHVLGETQKATSTATSVTQAGARLTAEGPVAAATSISTSGISATLGAIAAVAAIGAIIAALTGGFKRGGFTGEGDENEIAGAVHKGEFVFSKTATENIGRARLQAIHAAAPHFDEGGEVEPTPIPGLPPGGWINPDIGPQLWPGPGGGGYVYHPPGYFMPPGWEDTGQMFDWWNRGSYDPFGPFYNDSASGGFRGPYAGGGGGYSGGPGGAWGGLQGWYVDPGTGAWTRYDPNMLDLHPPSVEIVWTNPRTGEVVEVPPGFDGGGYYPPPGYEGPGTSPPPGLIPGYPGYTGMTVIGRDTVTGAPVYRDLNGRLYVPPGTGTAIAWYNRNYVPSAGIRDAIARGDYDTAYGYGGTQPRVAGYSGSGQSFSTMMAPHWHSGTMGSPIRFQAGEAGRTYFGSPHRGTGYLDPETGFIRRRPGGMLSHNPWSGWSAGDQLADYNRVRTGVGMPGFAGGGLIPGLPSTVDSMLAWVAPGEYVLQAQAVEMSKRILGPGFLDDFNNRRLPVNLPRFAAGGPVTGGSSSSSTSGRGQTPVKLNIAVFDDRGKMRKWVDTREGQTAIIEAINGARHEIGLGAVN